MEDEPSEYELNILNEIFTRAASDPKFRRELIDTPDRILARYNLSEDAKQSIIDALKGLL